MIPIFTWTSYLNSCTLKERETTRTVSFSYAASQQPSPEATMTRKAESQSSTRPLPGPRQGVTQLEDIPNVGPAIAGDLRRLGITSPADLLGRDPYAMYEELCRVTSARHDPCVLDVFIAAVRFMSGGPKKPWWSFTAERKRELAARDSENAKTR
jgi:hypothetical protein